MTTEPPETPEPKEAEKPLNREERRALARGKKSVKSGRQPIGSKKANARSQMPKGGVGKFQLPTKNG
ncbi:MAG TPA: hypothetical protein VKZ65_08205 [Glycomyces sp.]|nr:hypothetical protein [Glycomyces sp.]